jgi:hypothetical protein
MDRIRFTQDRFRWGLVNMVMNLESNVKGGKLDRWATVSSEAPCAMELVN